MGCCTSPKRDVYVASSVVLFSNREQAVYLLAYVHAGNCGCTPI